MVKPGKQSGRRYTEAEVRAILERALRDAETRGVSHDELVAAAEEIGISRGAIEAASRDIEHVRGEEAAREAILARRRKGLRSHLVSFLLVNAFLFAVNALTDGPWWFFWPLLGCGLGLAFHALGALSSDVSPRQIRRELERSAEQARKEQHRRLKEQRRVERLERKQRLEQSAEDFGHAVEEGVATVLSRIAQEIRGSAPPPAPARGEDAPRGRRIAPLDAEEAEIEELGEEEADRAARRGRGGR
ncbi:putative membrane protein [Sorangium cellulosum So ce56]|uniref:Membrane protein n=1 Tax=Sorangium cellulosum (strain So ce56) TaxID=448385 RepID=A9GB53_SORC5|nr:2TM domain-containing protein [Sorangium cellulosum]CAN92958.1 putative membrane protein [Sorangium cellulosum So ce56]